MAQRADLGPREVTGTSAPWRRAKETGQLAECLRGPTRYPKVYQAKGT